MSSRRGGRSSSSSSSITFSSLAWGVFAIGVIVGLIVSGVVLGNRIDATNAQLNFTFWVTNSSLSNLTDPSVLHTENLQQDPLTNLIWTMQVTEYPTYYYVLFDFGGVLSYQAAASTFTTITIAHVLPDQFAYQTPFDMTNPPGGSVSAIVGGYATIAVAGFPADPVTGLFTSLSITLPFGVFDPAMAPGALIVPRTFIIWTVPK